MNSTRQIRAVIFDMDGTLVDAQEWHYRALNEALEIFGFTISREDHEGRFDGLPTRVKLQMLSDSFGFPKHLHGLVNEVKQDRTIREIYKNCFPRVEQLLMMSWLKDRGVKIAVATNSIRETATAMLKSSRLEPFLDVLVTNEDVKNSKPHPDIYLKTCELLDVDISAVLVVEDHEYGVAAAQAAGCKVVRVSGVSDVHTKLMEPYFSNLEQK